MLLSACMKTSKPTRPRRRVRRARPLLIAAGALLLAGCGDVQGVTADAAAFGIPPIVVDMGPIKGD